MPLPQRPQKGAPIPNSPFSSPREHAIYGPYWPMVVRNGFSVDSQGSLQVEGLASEPPSAYFYGPNGYVGVGAGLSLSANGFVVTNTGGNILPTFCRTDVNTTGVTKFWFNFGDFFAYYVDPLKFPPDIREEAENELLEIQGILGTSQVSVSSSVLPNEEAEGLYGYEFYVQQGNYQRLAGGIARNSQGQVASLFISGGPLEGDGKKGKWGEGNKEGKEVGSIAYREGDTFVIPGSQAGYQGQDGRDDVRVTFTPGSIYPFKTGAWEGCFELEEFPLIDTSSGIDFSRTWLGCSNLRSSPDSEIVSENQGLMQAVYDELTWTANSLRVILPFEAYQGGVTWELYKVVNDQEILVTTSNEADIQPLPAC